MDVQELSDEEFARRGNAIFEERVHPNVDVDAEAHKFVSIDVETGAYAVHKDERTATRQLLEHHPEAKGRIWFRRVGSESAHHLGASLWSNEEHSS
ncbi:hypothetical protein GGP66_000203 [Salinibacter ruber]|uniref:hypothetical protein n=1 Tax=Salinibacter ruber TaxID=146919 RepID=UPI0021693A19|nr:hypothetical protein [Salinibacter ruber]MCS3672799.1 hypothetical protein [Salinibacter ruber]